MYLQKDETFTGDTALKRNVNGCNEQQSLLLKENFFSEQMDLYYNEKSKEEEAKGSRYEPDILDFLSGKSKEIFSRKGRIEAALHLELKEAIFKRLNRLMKDQGNLQEFALEENRRIVSEKAPSPILVAGEDFLESLKGVLSPSTPTIERFFRSRSPSPPSSPSPSASDSDSERGLQRSFSAPWTDTSDNEAVEADEADEADELPSLVRSVSHSPKEVQEKFKSQVPKPPPDPSSKSGQKPGGSDS